MVGSTRMSQAPGRRRFVEAMQLHHKVVQEAIKNAGGEPIKGAGDAWDGLFNHEQQAIKAAISVHTNLRAVSWTDGNQIEWELKVRVGLHSLGRTVTLAEDSDDSALMAYPEIAYASRIMGLACAEQILVSKEFYDRFHQHNAPLPENDWLSYSGISLKDIPGPHTLYERLWDGKPKGSPGSHWLPSWLKRTSNEFVGRVTHLEQINKWLIGTKSCMVMHGFGGVGKTRLASQALSAVADKFDGHIYAASMESIKLKKLIDADGNERVTDESLNAIANQIGWAVFGEGVQWSDAKVDVPARLNDGVDRLLLLDN